MNDKMAIFIFSVNVINRLLLSFLVLTKVITFKRRPLYLNSGDSIREFNTGEGLNIGNKHEKL